jgi:hypothetical protein
LEVMPTKLRGNVYDVSREERTKAKELSELAGERLASHIALRVGLSRSKRMLRTFFGGRRRVRDQGRD